MKRFQEIRKELTEDAGGFSIRKSLGDLQTSLVKKGKEVENISDMVQRMWPDPTPRETKFIQLLDKIAMNLEDAEYELDKLKVNYR